MIDGAIAAAFNLAAPPPQAAEGGGEGKGAAGGKGEGKGPHGVDVSGWAEAMAVYLKEGTGERPDPSASQPEDWDEEEVRSCFRYCSVTVPRSCSVAGPLLLRSCSVAGPLLLRDCSVTVP